MPSVVAKITYCIRKSNKLMPETQKMFCLRCQEARVSTVVDMQRMKNGSLIIKGTCNTCGAKTSKIVGKQTLK
jgi:RNase P subunit RPR2